MDDLLFPTPEPRTSTLITGPTGSGRSTCLRAIGRQFQQQRAVVYVDMEESLTSEWELTHAAVIRDSIDLPKTLRDVGPALVLFDELRFICNHPGKLSAVEEISQLLYTVTLYDSTLIATMCTGRQDGRTTLVNTFHNWWRSSTSFLDAPMGVVTCAKGPHEGRNFRFPMRNR